MNRRLLTAAMALSMSVFASEALAQAFAPAPATGPTTTNTASTITTPRGKQISFRLRNDSATVMTVQAGDQQITVAPGKSVSLKLATGTPITTVNGTAHIAAGGTLATVDSNLSGNTLVIS